MRRFDLSGPEGVRWVPDVPSGTGVLVIAGSSGRVDSPRAELMARHGALAESIRWFGGPGQHDGPWEIPLETFLSRVDELARQCDRIVVIGSSFGAEAALLAGAHSPRVAAVVAFAPSDVVWAGIRSDGTVTSHWSLGGVPLPFVPFADDWTADSDIPAYVSLYRASKARFRERLPSATIPVERIEEVLVVAGGDDQVWPSVEMAAAVKNRRSEHGRDTNVISDVEAGHRPVLPGEPVVATGMRMLRGGTEQADRRLGLAAWPHLVGLL